MLLINSGITNLFGTIICSVCHMWCRSNLALVSGVKLHVSPEWLHVSVASSIWRLRGHIVVRSPPGALQYMSLTGDGWAHLFGYFTPAPWQEETVTEAFGTQEPPCRIKQAMSQVPVTGNLTQITKGRTDCIWQVHPLPPDATSLFGLGYSCVCICIFGNVCACGSGISPQSVYPTWNKKVTFLLTRMYFSAKWSRKTAHSMFGCV